MKNDIPIGVLILFVCFFAGFVVFSLVDSVGYFSNEETRITTITDKWTDYNNGFYVIDSNNNIYRLFDSKGTCENSYRYKQIVVGNKYKLVVKTPYLSKNTLLLSEEKIV